MTREPIGWAGIIRLGLVQAALGAVVVLTISTMNRVMVVEMLLPATVPGALVALHYVVQVLRPRLGYGSDLGRRRTPWIVGGMGVLAVGGTGAAGCTALMGAHPFIGIALAVLAYALVGLGVGACGTSLLVLLAKRVAVRRRAAAATIVWIMMIAGIAVAATLAGRALDPFSPARLVAVTAAAAAIAFVVTLLAVWNIEDAADAPAIATSQARTAGAPALPFRDALHQVWAEPPARRFAGFVFVSMLAYSAQELILEPFAGAVFRLTPGGSTALTGVLHGGVLVGMVLVAICGSAIGGPTFGSMRLWTVGGCAASAVASLGLAAAGLVGPLWPLRASVFVLGMANGCFTVAAIGSMMQLSGVGREAREGVRMGLWGAAQAVAFAAGGLVGPAASDIARWALGSPVTAYAAVFVGEAILFALASVQAARVFGSQARHASAQIPAGGRQVVAGTVRG